MNYPCISQHGLNPFWTDYGSNHHYVGIMYAGKHHVTGIDEIIYLAINAYWEPQTVVLPQAPAGCKFYLMIDTMREESVVQDMVPVNGSIQIGPRSVMVMETFPILEDELNNGN